MVAAGDWPSFRDGLRPQKVGGNVRDGDKCENPEGTHKVFLRICAVCEAIRPLRVT